MLSRLLSLFVCLSFASTLWAEIIPVESFAKLPSFINPQLSPKGDYIAVTRVIEGETAVVVQPLRLTEDDKRDDVAVLQLGEYYINSYTWVNDERLVLSVRDTQKVYKHQVTYSRLVSIDKSGKDPVLFKMRPNKHGYFKQHPTIVHTLPDDDEHILVELDDDEFQWGAPKVHKVNVYTGKRKLVQHSTKNIHDFISDREGNIRIGVRYPTHGKKTNVITYYRPTPDDKWQELDKADYFDNGRLAPMYFHREDNNILIVYNEALSEENDEETELFEFDLSTQKIIGPYKDKHLDMVRELVEEALPDSDITLHDYNKNRDRFIIEQSADIHPTRYYVLDSKIPTFIFLSSAQSRLEDKPMASMVEFDYDARDKLNIPAYITLPNDIESDDKVPLIVFPHGGPWARDYWGFDNYVQFFANRGYAVFQPQFRGSTGFGEEYEKAGYKEWGGAIQDDITDGVQYVIENYPVDKNKMCIVGASFGGYAAAMGLAKTPELFQCGISINGVLDLPKFISDGKYLIHESTNKAMWNDKRNSEDFSPYHLTDSITVPLLLIANKQDSVVPYQHSKTMAGRLKRKKKSVEYLELKEGEHWRTNEQSELETFHAIDEFLSKHL